jgi:protein-disulfide isomerase
MRRLLVGWKNPLILSGVLAVVVVAIACTGEGRAKDRPNFIFKEGGGPAGVVASIDGKPVTEEELIGDERMEFAEALRKVYDLRMDRMGKLLIERVYGEEAKKAGMDLAEYLDKKVLKGDVKISDSDYKKFVQEKNIPKEQITDALKERIMTYMKAQKKQEDVTRLIAKLSRDHKVEVYFAKPNLKVDVKTGNSATFGSKTAKVTIVEFSDFQCPFCSRGANVVTDIKKKYGSKVQFAFKHFPLPMHPQAKPASEASLCVNEQSTEKFWKYHDKLFANQEKLDNDSLKKYAKEVGADEAKFNKCFEEHRFAGAVDEDLAYGNSLGVRSTPTFFINGRLVSGAQPFEAFQEIIEEELAGG